MSRDRFEVEYIECEVRRGNQLVLGKKRRRETGSREKRARRKKLQETTTGDVVHGGDDEMRSLDTVIALKARCTNDRTPWPDSKSLRRF